MQAPAEERALQIRMDELEARLTKLEQLTRMNVFELISMNADGLTRFGEGYVAHVQ